jgi:hypothetical protein
MKKNILVRKVNGEIEIFKVEKLRNSLTRSGATEEEAEKIINSVSLILHDGISSKTIYKKAHSLLKDYNRSSASKYSLKRAIFELGPTGYPFEILISTLLKHKGYETRVSQKLKGKCITHEVDVLAEKNNNLYAVECKFRNDPKAVINIQTPLYVNSRFIDIKESWNNNPENKTEFKQGWLVTNTRFSADSINYSECIGLKLLGWDFPLNNGIKQNVDHYALYPITTLSSLTKQEKNLLIEKEIILTKELYENLEILNILNLKPSKKEKIYEEIKELCNLD